MSARAIVFAALSLSCKMRALIVGARLDCCLSACCAPASSAPEVRPSERAKVGQFGARFRSSERAFGPNLDAHLLLLPLSLSRGARKIIDSYKRRRTRTTCAPINSQLAGRLRARPSLSSVDKCAKWEWQLEAARAVCSLARLAWCETVADLSTSRWLAGFVIANAHCLCRLSCAELSLSLSPSLLATNLPRRAPSNERAFGQALEWAATREASTW